MRSRYCTTVLTAAVCMLAVDAHSARPGLTTVALGTTSPKYPLNGAEGSYDAEGVYTLKGYGHGFYWGWDRGAFAYVPVEGPQDFTFTARLRSAVPGPTPGHWGLCAREGLVGNDRMASVRYDSWEGNRCMTWFYRFMPGDLSGEFCASGERYDCFKEGKDQSFDSYEGTWLRISRKQSRYYFYASRDGQAWTRMAGEESDLNGDSKVILNPRMAYVGVIYAGGGADNPFHGEAVYDNIELSYEATEVESRRTGAHATNRGPLTAHYREGTLRITLPNSLAAVEVSAELYSAVGRLVAGGPGSRVKAPGNATAILRADGGVARGMYSLVLRSKGSHGATATATVCIP